MRVKLVCVWVKVFFEKFLQKFSSNKEMQDNLKKFREEAQKLEESDALKEARRKFICERCDMSFKAET